jgi:voltage-gated potassium channel Kch
MERGTFSPVHIGWIDALARLLLSIPFALSILFALSIGIARFVHTKTIGFQSFAIISLASCGLALLVVELPFTWGNEHRSIDPAKVISSIMTGTGRVGAGALFWEGDLAKGAIFFGTAYGFVFQRARERIRTRLIGKALKDHYIVCGFGSGGEAAVTELIRQGVVPNNTVAIDCDAERTAIAIGLGVDTLTGGATFDAACVDCAKTLVVSAGRDDTAALFVLSARQFNHAIPISASVRSVENEDLLQQAGACSIINPVSLGGHLLARSSTHRGAIDYIRDLAAADGCVALHERLATDAEIGRSVRSIGPSLGVRLLRQKQPIGFRETGADKIECGDASIEIVRVAGVVRDGRA